MNQVSTHECACDVAASQITNYDLLPDFPVPAPFINQKRLVMAVKHDQQNIKFYFLGRKDWQKNKGESAFGIRSTIITIDAFNESFVPCDPDAWQGHTLLERKPCLDCGISKFTIEFHHNTQKFNTRSDVCIVCTEAAKNALPPPPEDLESMDRAIKTKFMQYMTIRPHYFTMTFDRPPTPENISEEFDNIFKMRILQ